MSPTITILLTVKNEEHLVGATIESILNQTYKNFEFWLVDDGSTDNTYEVIKSYKSKSIRSWKFEENKGMTERLNWLVPKVKTKYIARMDSHHLADKNRLQKQFEYMENNPDIEGLGSNFDRVDETGKRIMSSNFPLTYKSIRRKLMEKNIFRHSSMFFRTDIYKKVGLYDPYFKLAQDYDFILRVGSKHKIENLEEHLITEIYRSQNMTQRFRIRSAWEALAAQFNGLTKYSYPLWQAVYLIRGLAFLGKSIVVQKTQNL